MREGKGSIIGRYSEETYNRMEQRTPVYSKKKQNQQLLRAVNECI